jgi:hypothetical protein
MPALTLNREFREKRKRFRRCTPYPLLLNARELLLAILRHCFEAIETGRQPKGRGSQKTCLYPEIVNSRRETGYDLSKLKCCFLVLKKVLTENFRSRPFTVDLFQVVSAPSFL